MEYTALVILAALAQYLFFSVRVGMARGKYGIKAPATRGDEAWERLFRVQMNTLEQLIVFLPALVLFSLYVSDFWLRGGGCDLIRRGCGESAECRIECFRSC